MSRKIKLEFLGEKTDREDLLSNVKDELIPFIGIDHNSWNIFTMMIIEMIKNIYDHGQNQGYAFFAKVKNGVYFKIKNNIDIKFDYDKYRILGLSSKNTKENYGIGLSSIDELSDQLEIELKIDQKNGLSYEGVWKYNG